MSCDDPIPGRTYSHSSLSCYEHCPRKYQYRYIDGLEAERRGIEAFSGSMVHLALQHLHQRVDEGMVLKEEDLISFLRERWEENIGDDVVIVKKDMTRSDHLRRAETGLRSYHRHYHPFDRGCTVGLEHGIKFKVRGDREHTLVGYIDRLTTVGDGVFENRRLQDRKEAPHRRRAARRSSAGTVRDRGPSELSPGQGGAPSVAFSLPRQGDDLLPYDGGTDRLGAQRRKVDRHDRVL